MRRRWRTIGLVVLLGVAAAIPLRSCGRQDAAATAALGAPSPVVTQHNDNGRTGARLDETTLTPANVAVGSFGKLFTRTVDGQIYAQPLYVPGLAIGGATRDVVYVATEHDSVYAFDAASPAASAPLWHINVGTPASNSDLGCDDINPEVGITSTPVIDPSTSTLYFVAQTKSGGVFAHTLHAVDLATGAEKPGGPVVIAGSASGASGIETFASAAHYQRAALLLEGGTLYVAFSGHCDLGSYHGWVFTYDAATLQRRGVYSDTPDGQMGGIWMTGDGPAGDASGAYLISGNGTFTSDGRNLGDSFIHVSSTATLLDWFTPYNQQALSDADLDLGSTGALLVPGTNLLVGGGKGGVLYVVNRGSMGHWRSTDDGQIVQSFLASSQYLMSSAVYWNNRLYVWPQADRLRAFAFNGATFATTAVSTSSFAAPGPGGSLSVSANGATNGIVWALAPYDTRALDTPEPGVLRAFDATDLSKELWNSRLVAGDDYGTFTKFAPPTVANGRVYVPTTSGALVVYGLLSPTTTPPPDLATAPADLAVSGGGGGVLFRDDFSTPYAESSLGPSWSLVSGAWYSDGRAISDRDGGDQATARAPACADCSAEAAVLGFGVPEVGVFVRAPSLTSADRYDLVLAGNGDLAIRRVRAGVVTVLGTVASGVTDLRGSFTTLTLTATGTSPVVLTAAVNGASKLSVRDGASAALTGAGYAGLWTSNAGVVFDDFVLRGAGTGTPPPPDLAVAPPDLAVAPPDLAVAPPDLATSGGTLFADDFATPYAESNLGPNWNLVSGAWYSDGRAISDRDSGDQATARPASCANCAVQAAVLGFGVPEVGVFLRAPTVSSSDRYDLVLAGNGNVAVRRVRAGVVTVLGTAASGVTDLRGSFTTLTLTATGTSPVVLTAAVNGTSKLSVSDGSTAALTGAGYAGLWTSNAGVVFDNFVLSAR